MLILNITLIIKKLLLRIIKKYSKNNVNSQDKIVINFSSKLRHLENSLFKPVSLFEFVVKI